jgi:small multidrug resistance family-3 protein
MRFLLFLGAAVLEIGGCYLIWLAIRNGEHWLWLPAVGALALFGLLLALSGTESASRAFAVYGGVYIMASVIFMAGVERVRPDGWDLLGAAICIGGAALIFFAPRGG